MWRGCAMRKRAAVPALLSLAVTSGCVMQNGEVPLTAPGPTRPTQSQLTTASAPSTSTTTSSAPTTTTSEPTTPAVSCDEAPKELLDWTSLSISAHPGPVTGSAIVFAATTPTGNWYVVAIDRAKVNPNGTLASGHFRDLGLTDALPKRTKTSKLIPLGGLVNGKMALTWDSVSWKGPTLLAGKRAADQAIACLDAG